MQTVRSDVIAGIFRHRAASSRGKLKTAAMPGGGRVSLFRQLFDRIVV